MSLIDCSFISNELPDYPEPEHSFSFPNFSSFDAAQVTCGGSRLADNLENTYKFFEDRALMLNANEAQSGYYSPGQYCESGIQISDDQTGWRAWYKTTSGTVFYAECTDGQMHYIATIPYGRGNNHLEKITAALKGRTLEQYGSWYNSYLLLSPESYDLYDQESTWYNENMVSEGFKPMATLSQLLFQRDLAEALRGVYGNWASKYGIGQKIYEVLGTENLNTIRIEPKHISPSDTLEAFEQIQSELNHALSKIKGCIEGLSICPMGTD